jgi:hypothetical protein
VPVSESGPEGRIPSIEVRPTERKAKEIRLSSTDTGTDTPRLVHGRPGTKAAGRCSRPQRSGATSTFFLIRYQTAVATVKAINLARQFLRKSRFIVSRRGVRFRQGIVLVVDRLVAFAQQQFG